MFSIDTKSLVFARQQTAKARRAIITTIGGTESLTHATTSRPWDHAVRGFPENLTQTCVGSWALKLEALSRSDANQALTRKKNVHAYVAKPRHRIVQFSWAV